MKKASGFFAAAMVILAALPGGAQAKWWIFGGTKGEVGITYLFLNKTSFDEAGAKVTFYKEMLPQGMITVAGKASAKPNKVGSVKVSLDGKETWQDARLSQDGAFEFAFKPEAGRTYSLFIKVTDTTGKTNDVAATHREVTVTEQNIQGQVREALDKLATAYKNEDPNAFMALVAPDFVGDAVNLDRAVRNDLLAFTSIDLRYSLNSVSTDAKGLVYVSVTFSRQVTSRKSGKVFGDRVTTEFVFKPGEKTLTLYRMKLPLIFGLSDAADVGTGAVNSSSNEPTIVVSKTGDVSTLPLPQAIRAEQNGTVGSPAQSGTVSLANYGCLGANCMQSYTFATQATQTTTTFPTFTGDLGPFCFGGVTPYIMFKGQKSKDLGAGSIDSVTQVPDQSTYPSVSEIQLIVGNLYALYLPSGKYALIRIKGSTICPNPNPGAIQFDFRYQPDGTTYVAAQ